MRSRSSAGARISASASSPRSSGRACSADSIGISTRIQPSASGEAAARCAASAMAEFHDWGNLRTASGDRRRGALPWWPTRRTKDAADIAPPGGGPPRTAPSASGAGDATCGCITGRTQASPQPASSRRSAPCAAWLVADLGGSGDPPDRAGNTGPAPCRGESIPASPLIRSPQTGAAACGDRINGDGMRSSRAEGPRAKCGVPGLRGCFGEGKPSRYDGRRHASRTWRSAVT